MTCTLALAGFALVSGLIQNPAPSRPPAVPSEPVPAMAAPEAQVDGQPPGWLFSMRALGPATTTDPQHPAMEVRLSHTGAYRGEIQYQPTPAGRVGLIHAALGVRLLKRETWQVALDVEHTQSRPVRRLFRGYGWELDGHDRHQLSVGRAQIKWSDRRFFGLIGAVEVGAGRMHLWRLVSARSGADSLSASPDPILESSAPVGLLGLSAARPLFWGLEAQTHVRVIS
ncbi:MAG: hypothetical protein ABIP90_02865, partial [Vicinamibacterales bacterium]